MKFRVRCTFEVVVEIEDKYCDDLGHVRFRIEDNSCPGTSDVGAAVDAAMAVADAHGVCWACNLNGENKVLQIMPEEGKDVPQWPFD